MMRTQLTSKHLLAAISIARVVGYKDSMEGNLANPNLAFIPFFNNPYFQEAIRLSYIAGYVSRRK